MCMCPDDIINKVREHKHAYAERFGYVVSAPAEELLDSMLALVISEDCDKRDIFSSVQKREIISAFKKAVKCQTIYEQLGLSFSDQISRLKNQAIPDMQSLLTHYQSIRSLWMA